MSKSVLDLWSNCEPTSLGSVLQSTLSRWMEKVPSVEREKAASRFVSWAKEMQHRGYFGSFSSPPPEAPEFDTFMGLVSGSVERCSSTLQETGRLQKRKVEKTLEQAELLQQNCKCFLGEVKYTIQTMLDTMPKQMPVKTLTLSDGTSTQIENVADIINLPELEKAPSAPPPPLQRHTDNWRPLHSRGFTTSCHNKLIQTRM